MVIVMVNPDANSNILRPSLSTRITAAPVATTYDETRIQVGIKGSCNFFIKCYQYGRSYLVYNVLLPASY